METTGLDKVLREHRFFAGLSEDFLKLVVGCARNVRFEAGQYLFHEGGQADQLFLIRHGHVALEVSVPGRGAVAFQTAGEDEIVGVSWLFPPYRWAFDARAVELVRAIAMDGKCLREKCEADHDLGYDVMMRLVPILMQRLQATRMQVLDVYGQAR